MKKLFATTLAATCLAFSAPIAAQDNPYPMEAGEYVEVTGIEIDDGAGLKYAKWLAGEWRDNSDFAVSQGWLNSYEILTNVYPRKGEPDLYIIRRFPAFIDNAEAERRNQIFMARYRRSEEKLLEESAGRATYRTVGNEMLLRKMEWKD